jgi:hypothetical protein
MQGCGAKHKAATKSLGTGGSTTHKPVAMALRRCDIFSFFRNMFI